MICACSARQVTGRDTGSGGRQRRLHGLTGRQRAGHQFPGRVDPPSSLTRGDPQPRTQKLPRRHTSLLTGDIAGMKIRQQPQHAIVEPPGDPLRLSQRVGLHLTGHPPHIRGQQQVRRSVDQLQRGRHHIRRTHRRRTHTKILKQGSDNSGLSAAPPGTTCRRPTPRQHVPYNPFGVRLAAAFMSPILKQGSDNFVLPASLAWKFFGCRSPCRARRTTSVGIGLAAPTITPTLNNGPTAATDPAWNFPGRSAQRPGCGAMSAKGGTPTAGGPPSWIRRSALPDR